MADPKDSSVSISATNVHGQPAKVYVDAWQNSKTGLGTSRDKTSYACPVFEPLNTSSLESLYRSSQFAQVVCDTPAEDMTREGWDILADDSDEKLLTKIAERARELKVSEAFKQAISTKRKHGGAAIFLSVEGGGGLSEPLRPEEVTKVLALNVFDPSEMAPVTWQNNPLEPDFGRPVLYSLTPKLMGASIDQALWPLREIHASRFIILNGPMWARYQRIVGRNLGGSWGDSVLDATWQILRAADTGLQNMSLALEEFSIGTLTLPEFIKQLAQDKTGLVLNRLAALEMQVGMARTRVVAEGEKFERVNTPLTGLAETMEAIWLRLAAAARMPVSKLMGQAPAGLNATGAADLVFYYDRCKQEQITEMEPGLRLIYTMLLAEANAKLEGWSIAFRPLWQLSEPEKADRNMKQAQADQINLSLGVLTAEEVRASRFTPLGFSTETNIDDTEAETEPVEAETAPRIDPETGEPVEVPVGSSVPVGGAQGGSGPKAQDTALNGAQISSALEIVKGVANEEIPRDSGLAMLAEFFYLSPEAAEKIMGTIGKGFKPKPPEPVMAGPGDKPAAMGEKPKAKPEPTEAK